MGQGRGGEGRRGRGRRGKEGSRVKGEEEGRGERSGRKGGEGEGKEREREGKSVRGSREKVWERLGECGEVKGKRGRGKGEGEAKIGKVNENKLKRRGMKGRIGCLR